MFGDEMAGQILPSIMTFRTTEKEKIDNRLITKVPNKITYGSFDNDVTSAKEKSNFVVTYHKKQDRFTTCFKTCGTG